MSTDRYQGSVFMYPCAGGGSGELKSGPTAHALSMIANSKAPNAASCGGRLELQICIGATPNRGLQKWSRDIVARYV